MTAAVSEPNEHTPQELEQLRAEVQSLRWWHTIDLGNGIITPGQGGSDDRMAWMKLPENLSGKAVLDVGAFDGLFSFEAEKRGARKVVALDETAHKTLPLAKRALRSRVEPVIGDLRTMSLDRLGGEPFDLIIFMGVLYHMHDPMNGLVKCWEWCRPGGLVILETDSALNWTPIPAAKFVGTREGLKGNAPNWWLPNKACLRRMVEAAGFDRHAFIRAPQDASPQRWKRAVGKVLPGMFPAPWDGRIVMHLWK